MAYIAEKDKGRERAQFDMHHKAVIENYEKNFCNLAATCRQLGIKYGTVLTWKRRHPLFKAALAEVHEEMLDHAEEGLNRLVRNLDLGAIIFTLKCKGKDRGYIENPAFAKRKVPKQAANILTDLLKEKITTEQACIKYALLGLPLPEVLRIRMQKVVVEDVNLNVKNGIAVMPERLNEQDWVEKNKPR